MQKGIVARNFAVQVSGKLLAVLVGLISVGVLTRHLGTNGFGEYTTAITFLQLFGVVVDFGLTLTMVVMISEEGADNERIIGNIFGLRLLSGALIFSFAPLAVLLLPWSAQVKDAVLIGSVAYVLMGGATLLVGVFQRFQAMWRSALAEMVNRIVLVIAIVIFAQLNLGVVWMVGASMIANAVWLYAMVRLARPFVRIRFLMDRHLWQQVWSRSWPIAVSIFFNLLYLKGDVLFLSLYRSQTEVGLYGVTYRIIDMLTALPVMFMGILLPLVVNTWSAGNHEEFRTHVRRTFDLFMIAAIPIVIGTQVVAGRLMRLIAGPGYEASGDILRLLIFAVLGVFLGALFGHLVVAINKQKPMVWGYVSVAVLTVAGYFLFIPPYGMWGAAWMTLFSEGLIAIITFAVVYHTTSAVPHLGVTLKAIFASAIMYIFLQFLPTPFVLLDLAVAAALYLIVMLVIKGIKLEELLALREARNAIE
ncbi:flippase [Candidatus Uhrbacteria bacterium]|nr:flippase [Candidatus Uhrbacteria bacterium]